MSLAVQSLCTLGKSLIDASKSCDGHPDLQTSWKDYLGSLTPLDATTMDVGDEADPLEDDPDVPARLIRMSTLEIDEGGVSGPSYQIGNIKDVLQDINETTPDGKAGGDNYSRLAEHAFGLARDLDTVAPEFS